MRTCKARDPENGLRCNNRFIPDRPFVRWCSPQCGVHIADEMKAKKAAKEAREVRWAVRQAREKAKTRSEHMKEAQTAFNAYIRARDAHLPCVSCGRHHQGQWHAGHYRTVGANPELRFNELNVWRQCAPCNDHLHGNLINYRIELIKRIGVEEVEWLEGKHEPKKYSIEDLKAVRAEYKQKLKDLNIELP